MVAVIVKRRLFFLVVLGLAGIILLLLGLRGGLGVKAPASPGVQVNTSNTDSVIIEDTVKAPVLTESLNDIDFFIDYRLERDRTRGQQVEWLREVINNPGTVDETRQKAQEELMAISRSMEKESELENLIRAKGFIDAVVIVDEHTATAVVSGDNIDNGEVTEITELVSRSTGMEQQKIAVISKN